MMQYDTIKLRGSELMQRNGMGNESSGEWE